MATLIVSLVYGGLRAEDTPLVHSLRDLGYAGGLHVMHTEQNIGNRGRMYCYRDAVQSAGAGFDTVILTDARDVVFQRDPTDLQHSELDVYLEDGSRTIGSCPINRKNYLDEYGAAELERVQDRPISCAGVVVGTHAGVSRYLTEFCAEVDRRGLGSPWSQPLHAHLLWSGRLDPVRVVANEAAPVYTVGHCTAVRVANHRILNAAGEVPHIVHQFDRHLAVL